MESNQKQISLRCSNPECQKDFQCKMPQKPGSYKVNCPFCQHPVRIKIRGMEIKAGEQQTPSQETGADLIECPWGCGAKFKFAPEKDGSHTVTCPNQECLNDIRIVVAGNKVKEVVKKVTDRISLAQSGKGKLTVVRFHGILKKMGRRSHLLHLGQNTVGRYDADLRSDIEIRNDRFMSRRSIVIDVIRRETGLLFKMTVLNAANPVLHNSKPLVAGETVYLNYGDSIRLGKTTFNFEKA